MRKRFILDLFAYMRSSMTQRVPNMLRINPYHAVSALIFFLTNVNPGPEVIKRFSCSTQLSTKFQLIIKTKILTNKEVSCSKSLRCCSYHANKY